MTVSADEFIRRFLLHVLPEGFHRIRCYGFLGNRYRAQKLACCRELLGHADFRAVGQPIRKGLSRPLREAHRAFPQEMPGLSSRADDHHRNLRRRQRTLVVLGYVMKEPHCFHRRRIAPFGRQTGPIPRKRAPSRPPALPDRMPRQSSRLSTPESVLLSSPALPPPPASTPLCDALSLDRHHSIPIEPQSRPRLSPTRF